MAANDLDPRDRRQVAIWQAQGVLAERLGVDIDEADRGLQAHAASTGTPLYDVAWLVVHVQLLIDRDLCR